MKILRILLLIQIFLSVINNVLAQNKTHTDVNTPLYLLPPHYTFPYGPAKAEEINHLLERILRYLDASTPTRIIDNQTKSEIKDLSGINKNAVFESGSFRLVSYEWGVTYGAMLLAGEASGNSEFTDYTLKRIKFIAESVPYFKKIAETNPDYQNPLRSIIEPRALDDAGSMCAAMIKTSYAGVKADLRPLIDNYINYISTMEFRLQDGTLARIRPQPNTLWLDDLYMSVPALAQMGRLTGEQKYFDDATKQILQFSQRMFNKEKGLFIHGWVQEMNVHPEFHWGRANGWAMLAMTELLEYLPENHPDFKEILELLRSHLRGVANFQSGKGLWHQLLDRNDSYLETSSTAIFTYCMAHAINKGWIDPLAYGPSAVLAWNALSTKINSQGQVEGTCVGTGMGFDPAFYYFRPVHPLAAHGYGPVILAGAEMLNLMKNFQIVINETSVMFYKKEVDWQNFQIK